MTLTEKELAKRYLANLQIEITNYLFAASSLYIKLFLDLAKKGTDLKGPKFKPKKDDVVFFESMVYHMFHLDLAMVSNEIDDKLRTNILETIYQYLEVYYSRYCKSKIEDLVYSRLSKFGEIIRKYSRPSKEYWDALHSYFYQLISHAEKSKVLIKWEWGKDPLMLDIMDQWSIRTILSTLEQHGMIFEKACRDFITMDNITNTFSKMRANGTYEEPEVIDLIRLKTKKVEYLKLTQTYLEEIAKINISKSND